MKMKWRIILPLAALLLGICTAGCVSSKQESRKQAVAHWQQVRSGVTLQMARQQLRKGQPEQARESLAEALQASPDDPQLHLLMGRVRFELRDLAGALRQLLRAQGLAPNLAEVDYWLGIVAQAAGQPDQAHAAYQAAAAKASDSAEYLCAWLEAKLALGRPQEVVDLASSRFRDFPADARLRLLAGLAALQQGDLARAEELYEQAVSLDPSGDDAREGLARVLCQAGKPEQATTLLQELVSRPANGRKDLRPLLAACHLACGRDEKAERLYQACLADDPDQVSLRLRVNEARLLSGQTARVRQDLQALLERRCGDAQGWELLGHACTLEGDLPQARLAYGRAIQCGGGTERLEEYIHAIDRRSGAAAPAAAVAPHRNVDPNAVTRADDDSAR